MNRQVSIIEFNPTDVKFSTGYIHSGKFCLLQCSSIENFSLENAKSNEETLKKLITDAKKSLQIDMGPFIVLYPPQDLNIVELDDDTYTVGDNGYYLSINDYLSCTKRMLRKAKSEHKKALYCAPYAFYIDNDVMLHEFASGLKTESFYVKADVFQINDEIYTKYSNLLTSAMIRPKLELVSTYPIGNYISSTNEEKDFVTLKMDENYSYFSIFKDGRLKKTIELKNTFKNCFLEAATMLDIDYKRCKELFTLLGFTTDVGFMYQSDENITPDKLNETLQVCFKPLIEEINENLNDLDSNTKIYLYGVYNLIDKLYPYLKENISNQIINYKKRIIGSADGSYLDCVLSIYLATLPYQQTSYINNSKEEDAFKLKQATISR